MKRYLVLALILQGCGERAVKRMIIEPYPPAPVISKAICHLHFKKSATLKEISEQAAEITEGCNLNDDEFQIWAEGELKQQN